MTPKSVTQTVSSHHLSLRVSTATHAIHAVTFVAMCRGPAMLQAITCIQPFSLSSRSLVCPSRQLHHAFRPASAQLQRSLRSRPPLRVSHATPVPTVVTAVPDASTAADGNAPRVKAAFAEAGLSKEAIDYILTQYPYYLRWDVEQKLLPAMQRKQQELGARFPSAMRRTPRMLLRSGEALAKAQIAHKAAKAKAASGNASNVKAAFAETGLSQDAIDHILTQYPTYLGWGVEQKLLPAMQRWQQELEDRFVSEFERVPTLLHRQPEEEQLKDQYLVSIGVISPKTTRKKNPYVYRQTLTSLQRRVAFLHQCNFTRAQILSLIELHSEILTRSSEHVEELLRVIGDMFGCADRETLCDIMLSCRRMGAFTVSPATMQHNFTNFCTCLGADDKEMQRAWKHGIFRASPAELDIRLHSIAAQLNSTLHEAKAVVRSKPQLTNLLPETVAQHVMQLHDLGFSRLQVKRLCLQQPSLLTLNFNSQLQADKWAFLTCVLQLSHDAIVARPKLLMSSLPNRLGPRWEYLLQLRLCGVIAFADAHELVNSLVSMTDSQFRAAYTTPQLRVYDKHFQKLWQQRWDFLLIDQQLSIRHIADDPALLCLSLTET